MFSFFEKRSRKARCRELAGAWLVKLVEMPPEEALSFVNTDTIDIFIDFAIDIGGNDDVEIVDYAFVSALMTHMECDLDAASKGRDRYKDQPFPTGIIGFRNSNDVSSFVVMRALVAEYVETLMIGSRTSKPEGFCTSEFNALEFLATYGKWRTLPVQLPDGTSSTVEKAFLESPT